MKRQRRSRRQSRKKRLAIEALHLAVENNDLATARHLVQHKKVDLESLDASSSLPSATALLKACHSGDFHMVELLLSIGGANVHATYDGITSLHLAIYSGCSNTVRYLVEVGGHALMAAKMATGDTALRRAVELDDSGMACILIDASSPELLFETPATGRTALFEVANANVEMACLLLEKGGAAFLEHKDREGATALHVLAQHDRNLPVVKHLVEAWGANVFNEDLYGATPLHDASLRNATSIVEYLVQEGGTELVEAVDKNGYTALHWAAYAATASSLPTIEALVEKGNANLFAVGCTGKSTALHMAIIYGDGNSDVAAYLARRGGVALVQATNAWGETALHRLSDNIQLARRADVARVLVEAGGGTELIYIQDKRGSTALHAATLFVHLQLFEYLLSVGGNGLMNVVDNAGLTAFHRCAQYGNTDMIQWSVNFVLDFDVNHVDTMGGTALHHAVSLETIQCLFHSCSANISVVDKGGRTVLHEASLTGSADMVAFLLESYPDNVNAADGDGMTALHMACASEKECVAKARILMQAGADTEATNTDGLLPLHLACTKSKNVQLILLLTERFDNQNQECATEPTCHGLLTSVASQSPGCMAYDDMPCLVKRAGKAVFIVVMCVLWCGVMMCGWGEFVFGTSKRR